MIIWAFGPFVVGDTEDKCSLPSAMHIVSVVVLELFLIIFAKCAVCSILCIVSNEALCLFFSVAFNEPICLFHHQFEVLP